MHFLLIENGEFNLKKKKQFRNAENSWRSFWTQCFFYSLMIKFCTFEGLFLQFELLSERNSNNNVQ